MTAYIEPFDLKTIFLEYFLGSNDLFIFAFIIIFSSVAAKFNMSNGIFMILLGIGCIIFGALLSSEILILVVFLVGIGIFKGISRITQGG